MADRHFIEKGFARAQGFEPTPFERAKALVEQIYNNLPKCLLCGSDEGYEFSGWFHDYIKCRNCKAKWQISLSTIKLVEPPEGSDFKTFQKIINKEISYETWKELKIEEPQKVHTVPSYLIETINCCHCGCSNPVSNDFCGNCGRALAPDFLVCPRCRKINTIKANFCGKCGAELKEEETRIY